MRGLRFTDPTRSGDSHPEEQVQRIVTANPKVSNPALRLTLRRGSLRKDMRKLYERLKEDGL